MPYIARREDNTIILPYVVGGDLTVLYEAPNGVLVVAWPTRKHWRQGHPDLPVRYQLARLLTGTEADEARIRTTCNSRGHAENPDVFVELGVSTPAGKQWRLLRHRLANRADDFDIEPGWTGQPPWPGL